MGREHEDVAVDMCAQVAGGKGPGVLTGAITVGMECFSSPSVADSHKTSASRTVEEMTAAATIVAVDVPVALLIALNLLRALHSTGSWSIAMRPGAATRSCIGCGVALITGCGRRGALLGECERGGSKREPDRQANSFHLAQWCSPTKACGGNARRKSRVPQLMTPYWTSICPARRVANEISLQSCDLAMNSCSLWQ
jgi:hypothetical protein